MIRTNNCDDDQVLFMDVSLFSMCQSESLGTGNSVDMSITSGVSSKKKGEAFPQGTHRFETDMLV